jgi:hypothetical protein
VHIRLLCYITSSNCTSINDRYAPAYIGFTLESGYDQTPAFLDAEEIEEVIDTLTEHMTDLSQNDSDAYLEYFESDDGESFS